MKKRLLVLALTAVSVISQLFVGEIVASAEEKAAVEIDGVDEYVELVADDWQEVFMPLYMYNPAVSNISDGMPVITEDSIIHFNVEDMVESERFLGCSILAYFFERDDNDKLKWDFIPNRAGYGYSVYHTEEMKFDLACSDFLNIKMEAKLEDWERTGADMYAVKYRCINDKYTMEEYEEYLENMDNMSGYIDCYVDYYYLFVPDTDNLPLENSPLKLKKVEKTTSKQEETTTVKEEASTSKQEETTTIKEEETTSKQEETTTISEEASTSKQEETNSTNKEETTIMNGIQSSDDNKSDVSETPNTGDGVDAVLYFMISAVAIGSLIMLRKVKCVR